MASSAKSTSSAALSTNPSSSPSSSARALSPSASPTKPLTWADRIRTASSSSATPKPGARDPLSRTSSSQTSTSTNASRTLPISSQTSSSTSAQSPSSNANLKAAPVFGSIQNASAAADEQSVAADASPDLSLLPPPSPPSNRYGGSAAVARAENINFTGPSTVFETMTPPTPAPSTPNPTVLASRPTENASVTSQPPSMNTAASNGATQPTIKASPASFWASKRAKEQAARPPVTGSPHPPASSASSSSPVATLAPPTKSLPSPTPSPAHLETSQSAPTPTPSSVSAGPDSVPMPPPLASPLPSSPATRTSEEAATSKATTSAAESDVTSTQASSLPPPTSLPPLPEAEADSSSSNVESPQVNIWEQRRMQQAKAKEDKDKVDKVRAEKERIEKEKKETEEKIQADKEKIEKPGAKPQSVAAEASSGADAKASKTASGSSTESAKKDAGRKTGDNGDKPKSAKDDSFRGQKVEKEGSKGKGGAKEASGGKGKEKDRVKDGKSEKEQPSKVEPAQPKGKKRRASASSTGAGSVTAKGASQTPAAAMTLSPRVGSTPQAAPPPVADTQFWPSVAEDHQRRALVANQGMTKSDGSKATSDAGASHTQQGGVKKEKTKWIPIPVEITVAPSAQSRAAGASTKRKADSRVVSGEEKPERHGDNQRTVQGRKQGTTSTLAQAKSSGAGEEKKQKQEEKAPASGSSVVEASSSVVSTPPNLALSSLPARPAANESLPSNSLPAVPTGPRAATVKVPSLNASDTSVPSTPGALPPSTESQHIPPTAPKQSVVASRSVDQQLPPNAPSFVPSGHSFGPGRFSAFGGRGRGRGGPSGFGRNNFGDRRNQQQHQSHPSPSGFSSPTPVYDSNGLPLPAHMAGVHQVTPPRSPFANGAASPSRHGPPFPFSYEPTFFFDGQQYYMVPAAYGVPPPGAFSPPLGAYGVPPGQTPSMPPNGYLPFGVVPDPAPRPTPIHPHLHTDLNEQQYYVLGQCEYYFSPENLAKDPFLRGKMDSQGFVDITVIMAFKRITLLTSDIHLVREIMALSTELEVAGMKVRKKADWQQWVMPDAAPADSPPPYSVEPNGTHPSTRSSHGRDASSQTTQPADVEQATEASKVGSDAASSRKPLVASDGGAGNDESHSIPSNGAKKSHTAETTRADVARQ